jgi:hypothetical protein
VVNVGRLEGRDSNVVTGWGDDSVEKELRILSGRGVDFLGEMNGLQLNSASLRAT